MNTLDGLLWKPKWVSYLGCLQGCLEYLGLDVSDSYLFGLSGHAFVINIHEQLCPSGPTAWNTARMNQLVQNVGCEIHQVSAHKSQPNFTEVQSNAWQTVRNAIDQRQPCYGWELAIPEFYVIHGYDETGYYFNGPLCADDQGPKPWKELGDSGIGWMEISVVTPAKAADIETATRDAFIFALHHARHPEKWSFPDYATGQAAYQSWISCLEEDRTRGGVAYNAAVWAECRINAVAFLKDVQSKLDKRLTDMFADAIGHYETVANGVTIVSDLFPFPGVTDQEQAAHLADETRRQKAISVLQEAHRAEEAGLEILEQIANELQHK